MTPAQEMEVKRMTAAMWAILRRASMWPENDPWPGAYMVKSANILASRGFIEIQRHKGGLYTTRLPPQASKHSNGSPLEQAPPGTGVPSQKRGPQL